MANVTMTVNGKSVSKPAEGRTLLVEFLLNKAMLERFGMHIQGAVQGICDRCTGGVGGRYQQCMSTALSCSEC